MILLFGKEGLFHIVGKDIQNIFQNLFKQRGKWRRETKKWHIDECYSPTNSRCSNKEKEVVVMVDGKMPHGGLSDRLRGIVSVYSICKEMHLAFKVFFNSPFRLDDFLSPNNARLTDWRMDEKDVCHNSEEAFPMFCGTNGTHVEWPFQRRWFLDNFRREAKQIHVYTNALLKDRRVFHDCFHELFKMTPPLEEAVARVREEMGGNYISMTCRFQQLLGDFKEGDYETLPEEQQEILMENALSEMDEIHAAYAKGRDVLLTSDSMRFLAYAKERRGYVHTIAGELVHMDYSADSSQAKHLKSFTDLMVLSEADVIFLLKSPKMYNSGFPRLASMIGDKPFKLVRFMY